MINNRVLDVTALHVINDILHILLMPFVPNLVWACEHTIVFFNVIFCLVLHLVFDDSVMRC